MEADLHSMDDRKVEARVFSTEFGPIIQGESWSKDSSLVIIIH
jgi:hypothetical protein